MTPEELEALGRSHAGAIVTKSMTPLAREGNPQPRYMAFDGGSINSMGLPNLGYRAYAELIPHLKRFGKPVIASVAVIGATERPGSVGRSVLWNLLSSPFGGAVFPVNNKHKHVLGIQAFPTVKANPEPVSLAVVSTPAA